MAAAAIVVPDDEASNATDDDRSLALALSLAREEEEEEEEAASVSLALALAQQQEDEDDDVAMAAPSFRESWGGTMAKAAAIAGTAVALWEVSETVPAAKRFKTGTNTKYCVPPRRPTKGTTIRILYHITDAGEEINSSGEMLRGSDGLVGGGIYFAGSPKVCARKALSRSWLIEARVLVGRCMEVDFSGCTNFTKWLKKLLNQWSFASLYSAGYDSIKVTGLRTGDEYIVYNKDQVELLSVQQE